VSDDSLRPSIRRLLTKVRSELDPYGWRIHVERRGKQLSFEFRNPLSPIATGWIFDPDRPALQLGQELTEQLNAESEFARTKTASAPHRRRQLIGGIRWAAASYGWPDNVFREVVDTLRHYRVLANDEWEWLIAVGPQVLEPDLESQWRRRIMHRPEQSRT
jgi:hypothetical protein